MGPARKINNKRNKTEPTRETIKRLPEKVRRWSRDTDILGFISVSTVVFSVNIPLIGVTPRSILVVSSYNNNIDQEVTKQNSQVSIMSTC